MSPVAVPVAAAADVISLKETLASSSSPTGATLVIGSPATAQDGSYQIAISTAGGSDVVEKQMVDRVLDGATALSENKYAAISVVLGQQDITSSTAQLLKLAFPSLTSLGTLTFTNLTPESHAALSSEATLAGFVALPSDSTSTLQVQKLKVLTAIPLRRLGKKSDKKALWTLSSPSTPPIDADALLTAEDMKRPVPTCEPPVVGAPRRKKACKGCTCGLAELEQSEMQGKTVVLLDGEEVKAVPLSEKDRLAAAAKAASKATSSCGSCYLGDAFRCASCPYLGLPAFEPGQKVEIDMSMDDI